MQKLTITIMSLTLLAAPTLCSSGLVRHHSDHEETGHCEHNDCCPMDPCQNVLIAQKAPDSHIDDLISVLSADTITSAVDDDMSLVHLENHSWLLLTQIKLPFPISDVPLLI